MAADALTFPTIFLLPTHFNSDELAKLETQIPTLTYDINEAEVILGKISKKPRALLELRSRKLLTEEILLEAQDQTESQSASQPPAKRRRLLASSSTVHISRSGESTASDSDSDDGGNNALVRRDRSIVKVVRLPWLTDSLSKGKVLPLKDYLVYQGRKKEEKQSPPHPPPQPPRTLNAEDILRRAREDEHGSRPTSQTPQFHHAPPLHHPRTTQPKRPHLVQETTSEHEITKHLPPIPDYLHTDYSCQRPTPLTGPNDPFIERLKKMRTIRTLEGDEVGVRAYSTSIAAIAAYPYLLQSPAEVARLPGCGAKIVDLFRQWKETGYLDDVEEAASNPRMKVLLLFYDIWGVAAKTANEFYNRGWRDLDDVVEYGWDKLNRVQQIGVKYYEEFNEKIPRREVEAISDVILQHANRIRRGFQMVIVGGYRRGKADCGDVDVVLSHTDPAATEYFVNAIVSSLETSGHITHTLTLSSRNSERGQAPVSWKGENRKAGTGFDTLDKALVVWQDPVWDKTETEGAKNPNIHRRVDIIISPWRTAGCAVVGWSGGNTFERDLRRYCKKAKRLKFDSSGVRERDDGGEWVDLESDADGNPAPDMLTAERRVFKNLGLEWREPGERCTG
ncbi:Nucleotidyltransferase [Xylariaceae sp. FL0594]|nr:Nucleotidyltransferase [Xylariaceae sp. FL0594]